MSNFKGQHLHTPEATPPQLRRQLDASHGAEARSQVSSAGDSWVCKAERHESDDIQRLADLEDFEKVVIMTPSTLGGIQPFGEFPFKPYNDVAPDDEFRTLVHEIRLRTKAEIHHTIYSLVTQFTEYHECLLDDSAAVIVVVDQAMCQKFIPNEHQRHITHEELRADAVERQVEFAWSTWQVLFDDDDEDAYPDPKPSLFLIQFGDASSSSWPDVSRYDNVVNCTSYEVAKAARIADEFFHPSN